eukprot:EG_transcript_1437
MGLRLVVAALLPAVVCGGVRRVPHDHLRLQVEPEQQHAIIIDASFQGTRVHVYSWPLDEVLREVPRDAVSAVRPAFHGYRDGGEPLVEHILRPLIQFARNHIPDEMEQHATPLWLRATSHGMGLIPHTHQYEIMKYVSYYLSSCGFDFQSADIITELDTAVLGWTALNFQQIADPMKASNASVGFIQISAQMSSVTFVDEGKDGELQEDDLLLKFPSGQRFLLYSHFFDRHGMDSAWDLFHIELLRQKAVEQPCLPAGYRLPYQHGQRSHVFEGSGDSLACLDLIRKLLFPYVPCARQPCAFDGSYLPESNSFVVYPQHGPVRELLKRFGDAPVSVSGLQQEALRWLSCRPPAPPPGPYGEGGDVTCTRAGFWLSYLSLFLATVQLSCPRCARHHKWIRFQTVAPGSNTTLGWPLGLLLFHTLEGTQETLSSSFAMDSTVLIGCFAFLFVISVSSAFLMDFATDGGAPPVAASSAARTPRHLLRYNFPRRPRQRSDGPWLLAYQFLHWECVSRVRVYGRQKLLRLDHKVVPPVLTVTRDAADDEGVPLLCKGDYDAEGDMMPECANAWQGAFVLLSTYIDLGLLCLPCAVLKTGWALLPALLLLVMLTSTTSKVLLRCFPKVNTAFFVPYGGDTFANLTFHCLGYLPQSCAVLLDGLVWWGKAVAAAILLAHCVAQLLPTWAVAVPWVVVALWTAPVLARPQLLHSTLAGWLWALMAAAVLLIVIAVGVWYGVGEPPSPTGLQHESPLSGPDMATGLGVLAFFLGGHRAVIALRRTGQPPEVVEATLDLAHVALFAVYAVGIVGCLLTYQGFPYASDRFPSTVMSVVQDLNFAPSLSVGFTLLVAVNLSIALPAAVDVFSVLAADWLDLKATRTGFLRDYGTRLGGLAATLVPAYLIGARLQFLLALVGALLMLLSFAFPLLCHLVLFQHALPLRTLLAQAWMLAGCACVVGWVALRAVAGLLAIDQPPGLAPTL